MHPDAKIIDERNMSRGIRVRSRILRFLERTDEDQTVSQIAEELELSWGQVYFHLGRLHAVDVVEKEGNRPSRWRLSPFGQRRLTRYVASS
jgi:predicted ArsR family transcriptional regulator